MRFAYVDLETTGGVAVKDRIIEIAVVLRENNTEIQRWQTLLNPGTKIPPFIARYTGITDAMVQDAPRFAEIAGELVTLLAGATFVAHNVRFDYGFLKQAFAREQRAWQARTLCTVKLSRHLYPDYKHHNLDAIISRHQLPAVTRHRAMGDVDAMLAFIDHATATFGQTTIDNAIATITRRPSLPAHLPAEQLDPIPHSPGVYRFYGEHDELLYVGKSVNLYQRVQSHFSGDYRTSKEQRMTSQVHRIDWTQTAGELGALLLELHEIKEKLPIFNRRSRPSRHLYTLTLHTDDNGYHRIRLQDHVNLQMLDQHFGLYKNKRDAQKAVKGLVDEHQLCSRLCALENGTGPCFQHQLGQCKGACDNRESPQHYNLRLKLALYNLKLQCWPWEDVMVIREHDVSTGLTDYHLIHHWCHLATVPTLTGNLYDELPTQFTFERDSYRLLSRHILSSGKKLDIMPLSTAIREKSGEMMI